MILRMEEFRFEKKIIIYFFFFIRIIILIMNNILITVPLFSLKFSIGILNIKFCYYISLFHLIFLIAKKWFERKKLLFFFLFKRFEFWCGSKANKIDIKLFWIIILNPNRDISFHCRKHKKAFTFIYISWKILQS